MYRKNKIFIGLGTNLGNKETNLRRALQVLKTKINIIKVSPFMLTAPLHVTNQPLFLNAILVGKTSLAPFQLLYFLKQIERKMGREKTIPFGPRIIDLDILYYNNVHVQTSQLTIPHPRISERAFIKKLLTSLAFYK